MLFVYCASRSFIYAFFDVSVSSKFHRESAYYLIVLREYSKFWLQIQYRFNSNRTQFEISIFQKLPTCSLISDKKPQIFERIAYHLGTAYAQAISMWPKLSSVNWTRVCCLHHWSCVLPAFVLVRITVFAMYMCIMNSLFPQYLQSILGGTFSIPWYLSAK